MMALELADHGTSNDNASGTEPKSETITTQIPPEERSNPTCTHDGRLYPQNQGVTGQMSPEQAIDNNNSLPKEQLPSPERYGEGLIDQNMPSTVTTDVSEDSHSPQVESGVDARHLTKLSDIDGCERLSPMVEEEFLNSIRDKVLFDLGATAAGVNTINICKYELRPLILHLDKNTTARLLWYCKEGTEDSIKAVRAQSSICRAWPQDENLHTGRRFVLESDGVVPAIQAPWQSVGQAYKNDLEALRKGRTLGYFRNENQVKYAGYEDMWHRWCFEVAKSEPLFKITEEWTRELYEETEASRRKYEGRIKCKGKIIYCTSSFCRKGLEYFPLDVFAIALRNDEPFSVLDPRKYYFSVGWSCSFFSVDFQGGSEVQAEYDHRTSWIKWQVRYFRPIDRNIWVKRGWEKGQYLLSERQKATIRQWADEIRVQETRARVTFQVSNISPNLFHILVLSDESLVPQSQGNHLDSEHRAQTSWSRYGLEAGEKVIPVTHALLEICRVFDASMDAWGRTLDSIDELVHVNLSDFDDQGRVEDLMFDKSFNRSKDYFIALQLLRIVEEWIEEILPSMEEIRNSREFQHPAFYSAETSKNVDAVDQYMKERASVIQKRIRKKTEEINSLRDGLFNATSLREATKAMALNQAIYVFTVVTVLFTPVSFLATFWALPFLNNPTEGSDIVPEPSSFRNSFIVMPLLTYALVVGIAWHVGRENPNGTLLRLARATWEGLRHLLRAICRLRPRLPERKKTKSSHV